MAVVINGNGTVTGIAVGGLPDGIVDNGTMADDAIAIADLAATGTASSTTFLRGDNSWAAAGGGAWELIQTQTVGTSVNAINFTTGITSAYDNLCLMLTDVKYTGMGSYQLSLRVSTDAGSTWKSGNSDYSYGLTRFKQDGGVWHSNNTSNSTIHFGLQSHPGSEAQSYANFRLYFNAPADTTQPFNMSGSGNLHGYSGTTREWGNFVLTGMYWTEVAINGIQVTQAGGYFSEGKLSLYGIKHA